MPGQTELWSGLVGVDEEREQLPEVPPVAPGAAHPEPPLLRVPSLEEIIDRYGPMISHLARRLLGNEADAEDVTQDILLQVMQKRTTFRGAAAFSTWLYQVAVHAALAYRRMRALREMSRFTEPAGDFDEAGQRWVPGPEQLVLEREAHQVIEDAVAALPAAYRDVFVLADIEELSMVKIADLLGLSIPTVKSRLHRARLMLRQALSPYFKERAVPGSRSSPIRARPPARFSTPKSAAGP